MKNLLFVSGVARSGTSALVNLLNKHPKVMIGQERYFFRIRDGELAPEHFEQARFLTFQEGDTHNRGFTGDPENLAARFEAAAFVGDKFPLLYRHFETMFATFPEARHVYIFRNPLSVIESYDARKKNPEDKWQKTWKQGMEEWNESVARVAAMSRDARARFHLVPYEELFARPQRMNALFEALGLEKMGPKKLIPFAEKFKSLNEKEVARRDALRRHVALNADWDAYRRLAELAAG